MFPYTFFQKCGQLKFLNINIIFLETLKIYAMNYDRGEFPD